MASELLTRQDARGDRLCNALCGGVLLLMCCSVQAAGPIYSCIDANGKRLTSDRPIPECTSRDQRVLNADGSTRKVVPPKMTADEQAEFDARERAKAAVRAAEMDAIRRDRNLRQRYPTEAAHQKARQSALNDLDRTLQLSQKRLEVLAAERKPLLDEAEFYVGKPLPAKLRQAIDANDAATEAQRSSMANQQAEMVRINKFYDSELDRLRRLWAGAQPGTLGPLDAPAAPR